MAQGQPVPTRPVTAHGGNGGIKPGEAALEADFGSSDSIRDSDSDSDSGSDDEARETQQQLPSLYVHIFDDDDGSESVVIKIYDQGGGLREDFDLESLFRFAQRYTVWDRMDEQQTYSRK